MLIDAVFLLILKGALRSNRIEGGSSAAGGNGYYCEGSWSGDLRTCFLARTPVQTIVKDTDGKYHATVRPIEKVKKNDLVLARNEKTGKTQIRRVLKTTVREVDKVLTVALADTKTHKVVERITATREHPFYVEHKGFVPAGGLAVGNAIVTRARPALIALLIICSMVVPRSKKTCIYLLASCAFHEPRFRERVVWCLNRCVDVYER